MEHFGAGKGFVGYLLHQQTKSARLVSCTFLAQVGVTTFCWLSVAPENNHTGLGSGSFGTKKLS